MSTYIIAICLKDDVMENVDCNVDNVVGVTKKPSIHNLSSHGKYQHGFTCQVLPCQYYFKQYYLFSMTISYI